MPDPTSPFSDATLDPSTTGGASSFGLDDASFGTFDPARPAVAGACTPGQVLGDFVLIEAVGQGSFGTVWRGQQRGLERVVAVKVLHPHVAARVGAAGRFLQEAKLASRLEHPAAATVYAFGAEPDGTLWMALAWVKGTPLSTLIAVRGTLDVGATVPLLERLGAVVQAAHELGIVHRDLKPPNVMVEVRGGQLYPTLLDLGIARLVDYGPTASEVGGGAPGSSGTLLGAIVGSPAYMAPEQWEDAHKAGPAADQYALAALAYECLSGAPPFQASDMAGMRAAHLAVPVPALGPDLPAALNAVLARGMAKDPVDRYSDISAFVDAFVDAAGPKEGEASRPTLDSLAAERLRLDGPQGVADAIIAFESGAGDLDAHRALSGAILHFFGVLALAGRRQLPGSDAPEVVTLEGALSRRGLTDAEWLTLGRGVVRPFEEMADVWPVPELVRALSGPLSDVAEPTVNDLRRLVDAAGFLVDYPLVALTSDGRGERWTGPARAVREACRVRGPRLEPGTVVLTDVEGRIVLVLSPLVRVASPVPGTRPELFLLDGADRGGTRYSSRPAGFVQHVRDEALEIAATSEEPEHPPYLGLSTFTSEDAPFYVGREAEVEAVVNRLRVEPFVVIGGPSGAGKSSFVRAGVMPALGGAVRAVRPGATPLEALDAMLATSPESGPGVLVVDQFEELFTLGASPADQEGYAGRLIALADAGRPVILTLRDDFLGRAASLTAFRTRLGRVLVLLAPPDESELARIVADPLATVGYRFEDPATPGRMAAEVAGLPGALPLLSFAALELWAVRDRVLRHIPTRAVTALGGVVGALARHAEASLQGFSPAEQQLVRTVFVRLVTVDGTRAQPTRADLLAVTGGAAGVLDRLVAARLLVATEGPGGEERLELAHEALIRAWPRLASWLVEEAVGARMRDAIGVAAKQWEERHRSAGLLWRGDALTEYRLWRVRQPQPLAAAEEAFVAASLSAERTNARLRIGLLSGVGTVLIAAVIALAALANQAQAARDEAQALAAKSDNALLASWVDRGRQFTVDHDPMRALPFLAAAWRGGARGPGIAFMLGQVTRALDAQVGGPEDVGPTQSMSWAADGGTVTLTGMDGDVRVWRPGTGAPMVVLHAERAALGLTRASPGGAFIVTRDPEATRVWTADGQQVGTVATALGGGVSMKIRPSRIISAATAGPVQVHDLTTGALTASWEVAPLWMDASADGRVAAIIDHDTRIGLWSPDTNTTVWSPPTNATLPVSLAFSPDGSRVLVQDWSQRVLWVETATGRVHEVNVNCTIAHDEFVGNDRVVVSTRNGCGSSVWSLETGQRVAQLAKTGSRVLTPAPDPDGGPLRLWDAAGFGEWDPSTGAHLAEVPLVPGATVTAEPGTQRFVTVDPSGQARLYDASRVRRKSTPLPCFSNVWTQFSDDGTRGYCAGQRDVRNYDALVWSTPGGVAGDPAVEPEKLGGFELPLIGGAYGFPGINADGTVLVVSNGEQEKEGAVRVWTPGEARTGVIRTSTTVAVAAAGATVVVAATGDGVVEAWTFDGTSLGRWSLPGQEPTILAVAADQQRFAVGTWSGDVAVLEPGRADPSWRARAHQRAVTALRFSADGKTLVSVSQAGDPQIWNADTGEEINSFAASGIEPYLLRYGPGHILYTPSSAGPTSAWDPTTRLELARIGSESGGAFVSETANQLVLQEDQALVRYDLTPWTGSPDTLDAFLYCHVPYVLADGALVASKTHCEGASP